MIDNNTLYGIVGTLLFTSFVIPFLKALFGPNPIPKIDLRTRTYLPTMNRRDLALCVSEIINDPTEQYFLVGYNVEEQGVKAITFGYKEQGVTKNVTVRCKTDDSLPPKYPLSKRK